MFSLFSIITQLKSKFHLFFTCRRVVKPCLQEMPLLCERITITHLRASNGQQWDCAYRLDDAVGQLYDRHDAKQQACLIDVDAPMRNRGGQGAA